MMYQYVIMYSPIKFAVEIYSHRLALVSMNFFFRVSDFFTCNFGSGDMRFSSRLEQILLSNCKKCGSNGCLKKKAV